MSFSDTGFVMAGHKLTRVKVELEVLVFQQAETADEDAAAMLEDAVYLIELPPDKFADVVWSCAWHTEEQESVELPS